MLAAILVIESNSDYNQTENDHSISSNQFKPFISGSEPEPATNETFSLSYDKENVGKEDHCQLSTNYEEDQ